MVVIFKLSPNDQQVPGKLLNISRKLPGMLSEYSTQLNLNKHSYKTLTYLFVVVTLWLNISKPTLFLWHLVQACTRQKRLAETRCPSQVSGLTRQFWWWIHLNTQQR